MLPEKLEVRSLPSQQRPRSPGETGKRSRFKPCGFGLWVRLPRRVRRSLRSLTEFCPYGPERQSMGREQTSASKKTTKIGHRRRLVAGSSENNGSLSDRNPTCAGGADEVSTVTSSLVPVRQGGAWLCGIWNWPRLVGIPKSYLPLFCRRTSTDLRGTQHGRYASFAPERHALERQAERWRRHRIRNPASMKMPYEFDPRSLLNSKL